MWIRSQDKRKLININDLYVATMRKGCVIMTTEGFDLGTYSSEDKAIKVLDMIQFNGIGTRYFQMPKDSEVE